MSQTELPQLYLETSACLSLLLSQAEPPPPYNSAWKQVPVPPISVYSCHGENSSSNRFLIFFHWRICSKSLIQLVSSPGLNQNISIVAFPCSYDIEAMRRSGFTLLRCWKAIKRRDYVYTYLHLYLTQTRFNQNLGWMLTISRIEPLTVVSDFVAGVHAYILGNRHRVIISYDELKPTV